MPYRSTRELPPAAKNLPEAAKKIYLAAFNAAFKQYKGDEKKAFAVAMAAVKNKYKQVNGKWSAKADSAPEEITDDSIELDRNIDARCCGLPPHQ